MYSEGCPPTKTSMEFLIAISGWSIVYTSCLKAGKCSCNHEREHVGGKEERIA